MTAKLSPMGHIEIVVRDAEEAYQFLNRTFGAQKTQIEGAKRLSALGEGKVVYVVHVELGGVMLQFIEPRREGTIWADFLKEKGPGVHNLNFRVDNIEEALKALEKEGVPELLKFTTRPGGPTVYMTGGEEQVGFRFELSQPPSETS